MPLPDETFTHICSGTWDPVAGAGRVFIENLDPNNPMWWAFAGVDAPVGIRGYGLPSAHGYRSGAEGINVPTHKTLWIRGASGQAVALTAETLP